MAPKIKVQTFFLFIFFGVICLVSSLWAKMVLEMHLFEKNAPYMK